MKKLPLLLFIVLTSFFQAEAQITNDSATIKINPGATLYLEGDLDNINKGIITNEGTLEVSGEFNNELGSEFNSILTAISIFQGISVLPIIDRRSDSNVSNHEIKSDQSKRRKRSARKIK